LPEWTYGFLKTRSFVAFSDMEALAGEKNLLVLPAIDTPSSGCPARSLSTLHQLL